MRDAKNNAEIFLKRELASTVFSKTGLHISLAEVVRFKVRVKIQYLNDHKGICKKLKYKIVQILPQSLALWLRNNQQLSSVCQ